MGQNKCYGNILLYETSVISIMVGHFDFKHRCLVEKNVLIALIIPSRWRDDAESLGIEHLLFIMQCSNFLMIDDWYGLLFVSWQSKFLLLC